MEVKLVEALVASPELVDLVIKIQDTGLIVLGACFFVLVWMKEGLEGWALDLWAVCLVGSGAVVIGTALLRIWG